jgi:hypothetical protein
MTTFKAGDMVKFSWWTSYKAPSLEFDLSGHSIWYEIFPNDTGIVIVDKGDDNSDFVIVLFSRMNKILKIHSSMLELVI